ncbi:IS66 family insertion sequence element accessory protein TnpB [Desulfobacula toluolica]|nr:IS66 family insertion sequence element accessory protein TnpB [Desulfobacula toluolica]
MMFSPKQNLKIHIALGNTDMRKSIDGLSILVSEKFNLDPFSGHLFVFCNRKQTILKILYWDRNGFCLWHKRLEKDRFQWPRSKDAVMTIGAHELAWLIDGLSIHQKKAHKPLRFYSVF